MNKIISFFLLIALALGSVACGNKSGNNESEIHISGSTTVAYIMTELAAAFEQDYPGYKIVIEGVGSSAGVEDTSVNSNHIGMSSRSISDEERNDVEPFLLCKDALVLIVSKEASLSRITKEELRALYMENAAVGNITQAVSRVEKATTRVAFAESTGIGENEPLHSDVLIVDSTRSMTSAVADDPTKLGYISFTLVDDSVKVIDYSDGGSYFAPTIENIQSNRYSIYRPFYLVVPKSILKGSIQVFLDFCRSSKAREIMLENGLIPIGS